jgi:hypothetical protein
MQRVIFQYTLYLTWSYVYWHLVINSIYSVAWLRYC